jgi:uncharacterized membrane protein YozB (DUF420 family)
MNNNNQNAQGIYLLVVAIFQSILATIYMPIANANIYCCCQDGRSKHDKVYPLGPPFTR